MGVLTMAEKIATNSTTVKSLDGSTNEHEPLVPSSAVEDPRRDQAHIL